jgi:hypothetical protein
MRETEMKVRWSSQSLRLRITPTELRSLLEGESVFECFDVGGKNVWKIALVPTEGQSSLTTESGSVTLAVSAPDRHRLAAPDREGVYFTTEDSDGGPLHYYVEKDFPCIHPGEAGAIEPPTETFSRP